MISIIMPVWNRADMVKGAIESVLAQTFEDYELIIVDDGSDDNLEQVVKSYLSDKIILHRIPQSGVSHARNFGIQKARYPILAYLDSDNTWHPKFLETAYNTVKGTNSKYAAAYCMANRLSKNRDNGKIAISGTIGEPFSFKKLLAENYIDLNTFVHTKNLFNHTDLFDINLKRLVDWDIILRIASLTKPVFVPAVLVDYYDGIAENTISRNENLERTVNILKSKYAAQTGPFTFAHETIPYVWGDLNEKKHHNFWLHLNQQKLNTIDYSAWGYPFMLQIEPTNACNLECPLCPVGRKELKRKTQHMTFEMFKSIIDDMQDYLLFLVLWNWGEPLMNPQLPKMIRYASERDIRTVTSTNGHFLDNEDYMQQLLTSGLTTLIVAIDSLDDESYEIYRKKGSLVKAVAGLKNVVKMKKRLGSKTLINLRMVVMKQNEHELAAIRKLAHKIGVDWFSVKTLNPSCGSLAMDSDLVPTNPKYQRFEYDPQTHQRIRIDSVCRIPWEMANIFSNGDVVPCCYDFDATMKLGNIMEMPLSKMWNSLEYSRLRQKIYNQKDSVENCRNCWISFKLSKSAWFPEYLDLTTRLAFIGRIKRNVKEQLKKTPGKMIIFTLGRAVRKVSKAIYLAFTD